MRSSRVKGSGSLAEDFGLRFERGDLGVGAVSGLLCQLVLVPAIYLPLHVRHVVHGLRGGRPPGDRWTLATMAVVIIGTLPLVGLPLTVSRPW